MNSLQNDKSGLHVHTENIPQAVKLRIGKAFFEAYLDYEAKSIKGKEESKNDSQNLQNICGAL